MNIKSNSIKARAFVTAVIAAVTLLRLPTSTQAQEEVICTVVYGQGEVCGIKTPEDQVLGVHEPIEAGFEDINFLNLAAAMGAVGALLFVLSKLTKGVYLLDR